MDTWWEQVISSPDCSKSLLGSSGGSGETFNMILFLKTLSWTILCSLVPQWQPARGSQKWGGLTLKNLFTGQRTGRHKSKFIMVAQNQHAKVNNRYNRLLGLHYVNSVGRGFCTPVLSLLTSYWSKWTCKIYFTIYFNAVMMATKAIINPYRSSQ